jgi:hypothetical protein
MLHTSFHYESLRDFVHLHKLSFLFLANQSSKVIMSYVKIYALDHNFFVRATQVYSRFLVKIFVVWWRHERNAALRYGVHRVYEYVLHEIISLIGLQIVALGGLVVSVLATGPKVAGSNPAEDDGF